MNRMKGQFEQPAGPARGQKFFTTHEANRSLAFVRRVVDDILVQYRRMLDLQEEIESAQKASHNELREAARGEMVRSVERIQRYVEELDMVGVELRDWTTGVVDFPCLAGGRKVSLCWRFGDNAVGFWYEDGGELSSRQSIESLPSNLPAIVN